MLYKIHFEWDKFWKSLFWLDFNVIVRCSWRRIFNLFQMERWVSVVWWQCILSTMVGVILCKEDIKMDAQKIQNLPHNINQLMHFPLMQVQFFGLNSKSQTQNTHRGCLSNHALSKVSFLKVSKSKFSPKVSKWSISISKNIWKWHFWKCHSWKCQNRKCKSR